MIVTANNLIADLIENTRQNLNQAERFKKLSKEELNYRPKENTWTILECIEHLNLYSDFYLPEIEQRILQSKYKQESNFKSGLLGNYFAELMLPKKKKQKLKTFKDKNPIGSQLEVHVLERFINQQHQLLNLLGKTRDVSLTKTKTGISITPLIKLRLGDTLRFVINHNTRHILQAKNIVLGLQKK